MKKLMFITAFVLAALTLSAQGSYLTRTIKVGISNLEQPPFAALAFSDSTKTQALTQNTWSVISEFIAIASNDVTTSDDTITIQKNGGCSRLLIPTSIVLVRYDPCADNVSAARTKAVININFFMVLLFLFKLFID